MSGDAQPRFVRSLAAFWLSHNMLDVGVTAAVVGGHYILYRTVHLRVLLDGVPADKRPGLYSAAAVVISLTGTLVSVAVAQYLDGGGERMKVLKSRFAGHLGRTWRSVFRGSILAALLFLAAYAADVRHPSGTHVLKSTPGVWLFEIGAVFAVLRLLRLASLFGSLVDLIVMDQMDPLENEQPELSQEWATPRRSA